jgi:hypothetical protein
MNDRKEPDMKLIKIAGCASGTCPTVYRTDTDTLVVQGTTVDPATAGIDVPAGEQLVEIPASLLRDYLAADPHPDCLGEFHGADGGPCTVCGWDSHPIPGQS